MPILKGRPPKDSNWKKEPVYRLESEGYRERRGCFGLIILLLLLFILGYLIGLFLSK